MGPGGHLIAAPQIAQFGEEPIAQLDRRLESEDELGGLGITAASRRADLTAIEPPITGWLWLLRF